MTEALPTLCRSTVILEQGDMHSVGCDLGQQASFQCTQEIHAHKHTMVPKWRQLPPCPSYQGTDLHMAAQCEFLFTANPCFAGTTLKMQKHTHTTLSPLMWMAMRIHMCTSNIISLHGISYQPLVFLPFISRIVTSLTKPYWVPTIFQIIIQRASYILHDYLMSLFAIKILHSQTKFPRIESCISNTNPIIPTFHIAHTKSCSYHTN